VLPRRQANKSQPVALRHFSHWPRRIGSVGSGGPQGVSRARRGLRHDRVGRCRNVKSEGEKRREEVAGKAVGDECVFIPGEGPGWQMKVGSDAIAGRGGR
jgi:hypothetical protein